MSDITTDQPTEGEIIEAPTAPEGSATDQQDLITFGVFRGLTPAMRKGLSNYLRRNGFEASPDGFNAVRAKLQGDAPIAPPDAEVYSHLRYLDRHRLNDERAIRVEEAHNTEKLARELAEMQQPTAPQMSFLTDSVGVMKSFEIPENTNPRVIEAFTSLIDDVEMAPIVGLNRHQAKILQDRVMAAGNLLGFRVREPQVTEENKEITAEDAEFAGSVTDQVKDEEPF